MKRGVTNFMSAEISNVGSDDTARTEPMVAAAAGAAKKTTRVTATIDSDTYERLQYWSAAHGVSINEYLREALELKIKHENKDFDVPDLLLQRIGQVIDNLASLNSSTNALQHIVTTGFDSLIGLTRGDNNYLDDSDDGDIS